MSTSEKPLGFLSFTRLVLDALEEAEVTYCIGGAVALWVWGEGRTTQDFDLVIDLPLTQVAALSEQLKRRDMLVPVDIMLDLLLQEEGDVPINAIHMQSGYKAELFLLRSHDQFRQNALARRRLVDMGPPLGSVFVHAPEDLILYKIYYYSLGRQTKHVRDIASILVVSRDALDMSEVERWTHTLGLYEAWREIQRHIEAMIGKW